MTKILTTSVHGAWEYEFARIGYPVVRLVEEDEPSRWSYKGQWRHQPPNMTIDSISNVRNHEDADIIVVNKAHQLDKLKDLDIPKIFVPHTISNAEAFTKKYWDDYHVVNTVKFTEDIIGIKHSLIYSSVNLANYELYDVKKTEPIVVSMCAHLHRRPGFAGLGLWQDVTEGLQATFLGPGNEDFILEGFKTHLPLFEYLEQIRRCRVFFNPTRESIMPMTLYDAMASGMPIVTTATCGIPEVIKHGYNGYITNDRKELRRYIDLLMEDDDECMRLGRNARKSCEEFFNSDRMVRQWKQLIDSMVGRK